MSHTITCTYEDVTQTIKAANEEIAGCIAELLIEHGWHRVEVSHTEGCVTETDTYYSKEVLNAQQ
jgi:hypothetical protein